MRLNFKRLYNFITAFNFCHFTNYFLQSYSFITRKANKTARKRPYRVVESTASAKLGFRLKNSAFGASNFSFCPGLRSIFCCMLANFLSVKSPELTCWEYTVWWVCLYFQFVAATIVLCLIFYFTTNKRTLELILVFKTISELVDDRNEREQHTKSGQSLYSGCPLGV